MVILMKGMTCIKCRRKVAKVFSIFVIDYTREIIKETEEITNFIIHILLFLGSSSFLHE